MWPVWNWAAQQEGSSGRASSVSAAARRRHLRSLGTRFSQGTKSGATKVGTAALAARNEPGCCGDDWSLGRSRGPESRCTESGVRGGGAQAHPRALSPQAFPDNAARREVESLPAVCPSHGCTWKGTLKEYEVGPPCEGTASPGRQPRLSVRKGARPPLTTRPPAHSDRAVERGRRGTAPSARQPECHCSTSPNTQDPSALSWRELSIMSLNFVDVARCRRCVHVSPVVPQRHLAGPGAAGGVRVFSTACLCRARLARVRASAQWGLCGGHLAASTCPVVWSSPGFNRRLLETDVTNGCWPQGLTVAKSTTRRDSRDVAYPARDVVEP